MQLLITASPENILAQLSESAATPSPQLVAYGTCGRCHAGDIE